MAAGCRKSLSTRQRQNTEVPGSIPSAVRLPALQWVCNGVHSALVRINEDLIERKIAAPV
jgi:hypothetical protein